MSLAFQLVLDPLSLFFPSLSLSIVSEVGVGVSGGLRLKSSAWGNVESIEKVEMMRDGGDRNAD